jgi:hypothetical protein
MPTSPDEIQHMRVLIRTLWQELVQQYTCEEEREIMEVLSPLANGERANFLDI